jgi:hypothetical protein
MTITGSIARPTISHLWIDFLPDDDGDIFHDALEQVDEEDGTLEVGNI